MTEQYWMRRWMSIVACGVVIAMAGCGKAPTPTPPPDPPQEEVEVQPEPRIVGMADYEALLYDMTYLQVRDIMGRESDETEKEYVTGSGLYERTEMRLWHTWRNPDDSGIKVAFVNDRLREKIPLRLAED